MVVDNIKTGEFSGKKILIFQQRGWGMRTGHYLAKKLQAEGCSLAAFVIKNGTLRFVKNQKDVKYDIITSYDEIFLNPTSYLGGDDYTLEEICNDLEIDSVWPFVQSVREYVKSYEDKYYYGYKQGLSDEEIIAHVKATYKYVKYIFNEFKPDLMIAPNFVSLPHIFLSLYGKKQGVKIIRATDSRAIGLSILVHDYNESGGRFYERLNELNKGGKSENFDKAKKYIQETSKKLVAPLHSVDIFKKKTVIKKIREVLAPYKRIFQYYVYHDINKHPYLKVTLDSKSPKYILRDYFTHKRNEKFAKNFKYHNFDNIKKYIYFPLQYQPEETIDVLAPLFNNQLEVLRQVAMAAPGDYTVVVKEHPAMLGLRSPAYMEKIYRTPNVKFIDYRLSREKVMRGTDLVVNLSGTTLAEAAFLKKPAIQFGNLAFTKLLPNVFTHTDFTSLSAKMKEVMNKDFDTEEYDQQLLNYITAAYDVGTDVDYIGIWLGETQKKKAEVIKKEMENLWKFYKDEIKYIFN